MLQGKWTFYRATGQLWEIGHFKNDLKDGSWIRYNRNDTIEYNETFQNGKICKK
jgi:antitoxin component YwqK of YwqJK toxin-antitoxin module